MTVNLDRFAEILADRLAAIVPAGFRVRASGGMLEYSHTRSVGTSGSHIQGNFGVYGETDEDNLVGLAVTVLDQLEDYVDEATTDPWPGTTRQPRPHARISDEKLHLWYADDGHVVLACDPIELADITGA